MRITTFRKPKPGRWATRLARAPKPINHIRYGQFTFLSKNDYKSHSVILHVHRIEAYMV